jgi:DNA-binding NarL/FixJ family response regulator
MWEEPTMAIRVHLADDHTLFREGLESILSSRGGSLEVVGRSSTGGEDALALIEENKPDVVIMQIDVDLKKAQELLSRIRQASPESRIVVLTMFDDLRFLKALSKMGIDAYIHKSSSSEELLATIDAVSREPAGENVVVSMPRGLLERMGEEPVGALSERETEIVVLAARGLSNRLIAGELNLSEATVKRHLANVYLKIGVGSRSEAVRMALMEQWIGIRDITHADLDGSSGGSSGGSDGSGNQIRRS